jgi:hypothetical protein
MQSIHRFNVIAFGGCNELSKDALAGAAPPIKALSL